MLRSFSSASFLLVGGGVAAAASTEHSFFQQPEVQQQGWSPASNFVQERLGKQDAVVIDLPAADFFDASVTLALLVDNGTAIDNVELRLHQQPLKHSGAALIESTGRGLSSRRSLQPLLVSDAASPDGSVLASLVFTPCGQTLRSAKVIRIASSEEQHFVLQTVIDEDGDSVLALYPTATRPRDSEAGQDGTRRAQTSFSNLQLDAQADAEFVQNHGGSCDSAAQRIQELVSQINTAYQRDVGFSWNIANVYCDTGGSTYPASATTPDALLQLISADWGARIAAGDARAAAADVTHLFTGKNILGGATGGVVGLSYEGVTCDGTSYACGLTFSDFHEVVADQTGQPTSDADNLAFAADDLAHELGHTLNAAHCTDDCPYIMNPAINGILAFDPAAIAAITAYRQQVSGSCYCDTNGC